MESISLEEISEEIKILQVKTKKEPMSFFVPTKNGYHLITRSFNMKVFSEKYPNIDVHKDNMTILYCP